MMNPRLLLALFMLVLVSAVRQPRRTSIALSTIVFGVVGMIIASGFIEWNLWFGRESLIRSQYGHVRIYRPGYLEVGQAAPFDYLLPTEGPEFSAVESMPGVTTVAPRLSFAGLVSRGESTLSFLADGVDPRREVALSQALTILEGHGLDAADPTGFLLGQGLALNLGAKVGDSVVLVANTPSGGINAVEGRVRGLFSTITKAYDDVALRLPIATAHTLLRTTGSHYWAILLDDTDRTTEAVTRLRARLDSSRFQVVPWMNLADFYNKTAALFGRQMGVMKLLIAIIIVLSISNSLTTSVIERTREIGTSMALGNTRNTVLKQFVLEGAVLGLIGCGLGLALGIFLSSIISFFGIPMPPAPGMSYGFTAKIMVTPWLALEACLIAMVSAIVASVYPAWRASNMVIVDALRQGR